MRFLPLLALVLIPVHASASPACMKKAEQKYLECHSGCGTMGEGEIDCIRGCVIGYNIEKKRCQKGELSSGDPLPEESSNQGLF